MATRLAIALRVMRGLPLRRSLQAPKRAVSSVAKVVNSVEPKRDEPMEEMGALYPPNKLSPMECVQAVAPIEVEGHEAICDGGGGPLGHPVEFIQLHTRYHEPVSCKYCGLRFISKGGGHHH